MQNSSMQTTVRKGLLSIVSGVLLLVGGTAMAHDRSAYDTAPAHYQKNHANYGKHCDHRHAGHYPRWERHFNTLSASLQLSPRQQMELRVIFQDSHAQRKALRHEHSERVRSLLTQEQRHQWHAMREDRRAYGY